MFDSLSVLSVLLTYAYFWPVRFLFFRLNLTIFDKNDTTPSTLATKPRKIVKYISKLKPFTLYAFQVEAVVLKNEGAKSNVVFIQTKESGKLRKGQHYCNLQKKNIPVAYQHVLSAYLFLATMVVPSTVQSYQANWPCHFMKQFTQLFLSHFSFYFDFFPCPLLRIPWTSNNATFFTATTTTF